MADDPWADFRTPAAPPAADKNDPWADFRDGRSPERAKAASSAIWDSLKSIPRAAMSGLASFGALQRAGELQLRGVGDEELPAHQRQTGEEAMAAIEKNTGKMHEPETRAGRITAAATEAVSNPLTYAAPGGPIANAAYGAVGGAGGEAAAQMFPDHPVLARFAGGVLSALGLGATVKGTQVAARALSPLTAAGQSTAAGHGVAMASGKSTEELIADIDAGAHEIVPGSRPTLGQATGNQGILNAERVFSQRGAGSVETRPVVVGDYAARQAEQNAARSTALENTVPREQGPDATKGFIDQRLADHQRAMNETVRNATDAAAARVEALGQGATAQRAGTIIREEYDAALDRSKENVRNRFESIDPNGEINLDMTPAQDAAEAALTKFLSPRAGGPPPELRQLVDDLGEQNLTYKDVQDIRSRLSRIQNQHRGDNQVQGATNRIREAIDDHIDDTVHTSGGFTNAQIDAYEAARAARARQGQLFERGPSTSIGKQKAFGERALSPAEVPQAYFNKSAGAADDIDQFFRTFGRNERARRAMDNYIIRDMRDYVMDPAGNVDPRRLAKWTADHRDALSHPELVASLSDRINSVSAAQRAIGELSGPMTRSIEDFERGAARHFLQNDPEAAISKALASSTARSDIRDLVNLANQDRTGDALRGLRRGIIDNAAAKATTTATDIAGAPVLANAGFTRWLRNNRANIAPAFEPGHLDMLDRIGQDLQRTQLSTRGAMGGNSVTFQNLATSQLLDSIPLIAKFKTVIPSTFGRTLDWVYRVPNQNIERMMAEAMLDPQYAKTLLMRVTPDSAAGIGRRVMRQMAGIRPAVVGGVVGGTQPGEKENRGQNP